MVSLAQAERTGLTYSVPDPPFMAVSHVALPLGVPASTEAAPTTASAHRRVDDLMMGDDR